MRTASTAAVLLLATVAVADGPTAGGPDPLRGSWQVEDGRVHLGPLYGALVIPRNGHLKPRLRVAGGEWTFTFAPPLAAEPQGATRRWRATLGGGKDARAVDLEGLDGDLKGKTCRGVYALDGDTLRLTYAPPGADRPARVDADVPRGTHLRLVRAKE